MHRLRGWELLHEHRRYDFDDMYHLPYQFQLANCKLSPRFLHVQRWVNRPKRRHVHRLRRWKIQDEQR